MKKHTCQGCPEYQSLNRRDFLKFSGLGAAALLAPSWLPRVAYAQAGPARDVVISIFLRGGADGLSLCVPYGDDGYYNARPTEAIPKPGAGDNRALKLDDLFALPPAMQALLPVYKGGDLAIIHACGLTESSRSHFNAQFTMETGDTGEQFSATGWLARHLLNTAPRDPQAVLRAIAINQSVQRTLAGGPETLPVPDPGAYLFGNDDPRVDILKTMYSDVPEPLATASQNTLRTLSALEAIDYEHYAPAGGAQYPDNDPGRALRSTAALLKANIGVEAFAVDVDGWDTHAGQGALYGGLAQTMRGLADALAAFHTDVIKAGIKNVVVSVMSEFGRNVIENASRGTDHGYGGVMFVLGGHVNGGKVYGDWPGVGEEQLFEGQDLDITTDYRDVLSEILQKRAATANLDAVFPGYTPQAVGVVS